MVTDISLKTALIPDMPNKILVAHNMENYFVVNVLDASDFSQQQEAQWKTENPYYASTEPVGRYFLLTIEYESLESKFTDDMQTWVKTCASALKTAGDFWFDYITSTSN